MDVLDHIKQQMEIHKQKQDISRRHLVEIRQEVPSNLVTQFLKDYKPFVKKFFGDMTVKTIRWDDQLLKFVQKEVHCDQAYCEFLNTVDRFYHSEKYWRVDPVDQYPNIRVWVEKQNTIATLEGF